MNAKITGQIISRRRKSLGLTQLQLAELINVSNRTISKWENGDGFPDISLLPLLSKTLGITIDELLTGEKANTDIEAKPQEDTEKKSSQLRAKFTVSEIIAFCLVIAMNIIGGATEVMLFNTHPFYMFIEIYLLVIAVILLTFGIIVFFTGLVRYKAEVKSLKSSVIYETYIFILLCSLTPALTITRMLSGYFTDNGYFLRYAFIVFYVIAIAVISKIFISKARSCKNEKD
ncbi:MAG: helix-turn-helix domain-containing protein [Clostridiales bacterium]|nr:helix-turn-helix domain-containing protein [Clostridiales bacterium]